jgi:hypothetical protein
MQGHAAYGKEPVHRKIAAPSAPLAGKGGGRMTMDLFFQDMAEKCSLQLITALRLDAPGLCHATKTNL